MSNKVPKKDKCWVESFVLSFSTDGSNWRHCTENGAVKVRVQDRIKKQLQKKTFRNEREARHTARKNATTVQ